MHRELAVSLASRATAVDQASLVHVVTLANLERQVLSACWDLLVSQEALVQLVRLDDVEVLEHKDLLVSREILDLLVELASKEISVQLVKRESLVYKALLDNPEYKVAMYMYAVDHCHILTVISVSQFPNSSNFCNEKCLFLIITMQYSTSQVELNNMLPCRTELYKQYTEPALTHI